MSNQLDNQLHNQLDALAKTKAKLPVYEAAFYFDIFPRHPNHFSAEINLH